MDSFLPSGFLALGLMLTTAGCSPWQMVNIGGDGQRPDWIGQGGPIRVTTIDGNTYEGKGLKESTQERLVMELGEPGSDSRLSGMILSIPWNKVKQIRQWVPIY